MTLIPKEQTPHKKLGTIAFDPYLQVIDQEPYSLSDYLRQIKRWYLGFWQTARRHGFWPSFFWFTMASFTLEMVVFSIFLLLVPMVLLRFLLVDFAPIQVLRIGLVMPSIVTLSLSDLLIGLFLTDFLMTIFVAAIERKPILLAYWFAFPIIRYLDAAVFLWTIPLAFMTKSSGAWMSPTRR